jgi:glucosylceramidase
MAAQPRRRSILMRRIRQFILLGGLAPAIALATPNRVWTVIETARDNGHRLTTMTAPTTEPSTPAVLISCDPGKPLQEIVGFGGALTESSAWVLAQLAPAERAEILRRYYDPNQGIGYTLARTHINSCDFSLHTWSLDETPGDYDLLNFSLEPMRKWLLPLLHEAQAIAGSARFKLLASPWSPPAWMKTNHRMDDGGALRPEYQPSWAQFFVRFVQAMRDEEKIPVWALTVQNEPEAHQTWESCLYTPEEERDFVRDHLGPALEKAGLSEIKLLGWDHNRDRLEARAGVLFGDPGASKYLWGAALHWYISDDFAAASRVHDAFPPKQILFTEGCLAKSTEPASWTGGEQYAENIMGDLSNWVCGWIDWNIVLDLRGGPNHVGNFCDAPVLVDTQTGTVHYQSSFYYIAHFSRYVQVGAHRIVSTGSARLESIAFQNPDGSVAVVVMNRTDSPVEGVIAISTERVAMRLPPHSIQTLVGNGR